MDSTDNKKTRKVMKNATNVQLDKVLLMWFVQKRNLGNPMLGPILDSSSHICIKMDRNILSI